MKLFAIRFPLWCFFFLHNIVHAYDDNWWLYLCSGLDENFFFSSLVLFGIRMKNRKHNWNNNEWTSFFFYSFSSINILFVYVRYISRPLNTHQASNNNKNAMQRLWTSIIVLEHTFSIVIHIIFVNTYLFFKKKFFFVVFLDCIREHWSSLNRNSASIEKKILGKMVIFWWK